MHLVVKEGRQSMKRGITRREAKRKGEWEGVDVDLKLFVHVI
jgi:hypothetical protein